MTPALPSGLGKAAKQASCPTAVLLLTGRLSGNAIRQYRKLKAEAGPARRLVLIGPPCEPGFSLPTWP